MGECRVGNNNTMDCWGRVGYAMSSGLLFIDVIQLFSIQSRPFSHGGLFTRKGAWGSVVVALNEIYIYI